MRKLGQFEGAKIQRIQWDPSCTSFDLELVDGSTRTLCCYAVFDDERVAIRIDGMFVPPEELP